MGYREFQRNEKRYRYSDIRRPSGRPTYAYVHVGRGQEGWAVVGNVDVLDGIWNVSNGLDFDHDHRKGQ